MNIKVGNKSIKYVFVKNNAIDYAMYNGEPHIYIDTNKVIDDNNYVEFYKRYFSTTTSSPSGFTDEIFGDTVKYRVIKMNYEDVYGGTGSSRVFLVGNEGKYIALDDLQDTSNKVCFTLSESDFEFSKVGTTTDFTKIPFKYLFYASILYCQLHIGNNNYFLSGNSIDSLVYLQSSKDSEGNTNEIYKLTLIISGIKKEYYVWYSWYGFSDGSNDICYTINVINISQNMPV